MNDLFLNMLVIYIIENLGMEKEKKMILLLLLNIEINVDIYLYVYCLFEVLFY